MINQAEFQVIKDKFNQKKTEKKLNEIALSAEKVKLANLKQYETNAIQARAILQRIAKNTQQNIEDKFSELVTLAVQSVFQNDYEFRIRFIEKRGKTECECFIVTNGVDECEIISESGGGLADIVSFGTRIAFWSLNKKTRPIFFLDEPIKFLHSSDYQENFSELLQVLSTKLGIQFIIVSDQQNIHADKKFTVINGTVIEDNNDT